MRFRRVGRAAMVLAAVAVALSVAGVACGDDDGSPKATVHVEGAREPAAMVPLPDGGLLYGERRTGRVRRVDADGRLQAAAVAELAVSTDGQRGLLGLAVDRGRTFAAWTDPDRHLVVAQVAPGAVRPIWELARTADLANGGRLAVGEDGSLLVAVGDLQQPERIRDPDAPNGKILALDVEGAVGQRPRVVSSGWNNPFAFTVTAAGEVWVADNAPGDQAERLARAAPPGPVTELPTRTAPSGLAATDDGGLLVCGYVTADLLRYEVDDDRARRERDGPLADDCRLGVAVLTDGRVVYATDDAIMVIPTG